MSICRRSKVFGKSRKRMRSWNTRGKSTRQRSKGREEKRKALICGGEQSGARI